MWVESHIPGSPCITDAQRPLKMAPDLLAQSGNTNVQPLSMQWHLLSLFQMLTLSNVHLSDPLGAQSLDYASR